MELGNGNPGSSGKEYGKLSFETGDVVSLAEGEEVSAGVERIGIDNFCKKADASVFEDMPHNITTAKNMLMYLKNIFNLTIFSKFVEQLRQHRNKNRSPKLCSELFPLLCVCIPKQLMHLTHLL